MMETETRQPAYRYIGQPVVRREDLRLVSGRGTYVNDVVVPTMLHAAFVRSDVARGVIRHLDTRAAEALQGVHAVLTADELSPMIHEMWATMPGRPPDTPYPPQRPLAEHDVRFVGDPIALILADSRPVAKDACELVDVAIDRLTPILNLDAAVRDQNERVHPELTSNVAAEIRCEHDPVLDEIIAAAPHVVSRTFRMGRVTNSPLEPRGIIAHWNAYGPEMRIWSSTQNPHEVRAYCARLLGLSENYVRVTMKDVGGGFGQKVFVSREEAAVMLAAFLLQRPIKWIEDRRENLTAASQARSEWATVTIAADTDGHIIGGRVHHVEEVGAYPVGGVASVGGLVRMMFTGPYRIPRLSFSNQAVYTNTCGRTAYRGPWLMETFAREQIIDDLARKLKIDPLELRRRNLVSPADLPYELPSGAVYDAITAQQTIEQAAAMLRYPEYRQWQSAARDTGRLVGLGISVYIEPSGASRGVLSTDQATLRIEPSGAVSVLMGTGSTGNSIETTIPQIVAEHLGCTFDDVVLRQGDTAAAPFGSGTAGSRSAPIAGAAAHLGAIEMRARIVQIAAHVLEASEEDLQIDNGVIQVRGTPSRTVTFRDIAEVAYFDPGSLPAGTPPGLEVVTRFKPANTFTWSNACHLCTCEIDPETGRVSLDRYVVSEDCGTIINPNVVDGQIAGGAAQGIGQVLFEHMSYDADGNPTAATFLDYLLATSNEIPPFEIGHIETPSAIPGGYKGMAEGGAIGAPAAVANAIADALSPLNVQVSHTPVGPSDVWKLIQEASPSCD